MSRPPGAPRLPADRDPGDAWVEAPSGERYWGRFGAAGLLAHDSARGVLLQHRASWSHHGDTWGIPGGALHEGEAAITAALREAHEEAGVPADAVTPQWFTVLDRDVWTYTTVVAVVERPFEPVAGDAESHELRWVPREEVNGLPLHPAFGAAWEGLDALLDVRVALLVDAANVVGSVPDGWWKDRAAATARLGQRLEPLLDSGVPGLVASADASVRWLPRIEVVLEGAARGASMPEGIAAIPAPRDGDAMMVERTAALVEEGLTVVAVTSDRALRSRLESVGAEVQGVRWLLDLTGAARS